MAVEAPYRHMKRKAQLYLIVVSIGRPGQFSSSCRRALTSRLRSRPELRRAQVEHAAPAGADFLSAAKSSLWQNGTSPLSRLLLQVFHHHHRSGTGRQNSSTCGSACCVVGEMVAGILLGPVALWVDCSRGPFSCPFPTSSFEPLRLFSQIRRLPLYVCRRDGTRRSATETKGCRLRSW